MGKPKLYKVSSEFAELTGLEGKRGFTCCGEFHPFSPWVFAHMDIEIQFVCPKCKKKFPFVGEDLI